MLPRRAGRRRRSNELLLLLLVRRRGNRNWKNGLPLERRRQKIQLFPLWGMRRVT